MSQPKKQKAKLFALMDCNNFFVSCERVFNPKIVGKPALVLSSNDGCVIARSEETKKIGIPMGIPVFKIRHQITKHNIHLNSSNFRLYRDMSSRVMNILNDSADEMEVYSIDEAFIDLSEFVDNPEGALNFCRELRSKIMQYTGIPVSFGIANTKTLCKTASKIAKKSDGAFYLNHNNLEILANTEIGDVWGIGRQLSKSLKDLGVTTSLQFMQKSSEWVKNKFSEPVFYTHQELNGVRCFDLNNDSTTRKSIISSRSFGKPVIDRSELKQSIISHIENACQQMREEKTVTKDFSVMISTGFNRNQNSYEKIQKVSITKEASDQFTFIEKIDEVLDEIYKPGLRYKKSGVCFYNLIPEYLIENETLNLFSDSANEESKNKKNILATTIDSINSKFGINTIHSAGSGLKKGWKPSSSYRSDEFTTNWNQILKIDKTLL